MIGYGSKNKHQKTSCVEKRLDYIFKNVLNILHVIVNIIGGDLYDHLITQRTLISTMDRIRYP
jgi:hypothetical protein